MNTIQSAPHGAPTNIAPTNIAPTNIANTFTPTQTVVTQTPILQTVVGYARVSTDLQREKESIRTQIECIEAECRARGW